MKRVAFVFSFGIVAAVFLFLPIHQVFSFTEIRTNHPEKFYINISDENVFQIRYTHSIHLTDVLETYEIADANNLKLVSMEYEDVSIGMPAYAEKGETLAYEDGRYILSFEDKVLSDFTLYVGDIDLDLYFLYDDQSYNLKSFLQRGKSYLFEIKKVSLIEKWKGAVFDHGEAAE
ncbi:DUF1850 domain-containing protein [Lysinibacillus telephonicus]|uniref:DUF1850 domain-containing protein n=1 Tax=Lysinibacillus telephonicus TaxID=1714840 RepID=A0A431UM05_9BACI|nr:DUF1850 domain-containing protein [Lysinibacillus telephonicus]RTQ90476.1 DUF1850 domain-containing protein [Lysinibacillus telephonicus]